MSPDNGNERGTGSRQVHFLNFYTASAGIAPRSMDVYVRRGRRLQAEAVRHGFVSVFGAILTLARRALAYYRRRRAERHTERVLRALSPRMLRDIGIEGHQIPAIARDLHTRTEGAKTVPATARPAVTRRQLDRAA